jgi:hypothetical protein
MNEALRSQPEIPQCFFYEIAIAFKDISIYLLEMIDAIMEARRIQESLENQTIGAELFPTNWRDPDLWLPLLFAIFNEFLQVIEK